MRGAAAHQATIKSQQLAGGLPYAYLVPDGLPDSLLVRQLRELAWAIKARPVTVLFVGPTFPDNGMVYLRYRTRPW